MTVKLVVLYTQPADPAGFDEHYLGVHIPLVAKIPGLFAGISSSGLLGFVWYDLAQNDGIYHQDWRLEGDTNAVAAFRAAAATYLSSESGLVRKLDSPVPSSP